MVVHLVMCFGDLIHSLCLLVVYCFRVGVCVYWVCVCGWVCTGCVVCACVGGCVLWVCFVLYLTLIATNNICKQTKRTS